jgi:hypothetical protein
VRVTTAFKRLLRLPGASVIDVSFTAEGVIVSPSAGATDRDDERETTPEELRQAARFLEAVALDAVTQFSQLARALATGGAKDFPRPSPEDRAAIEGSRRLRRRLEGVVAELYALASGLEAGLAVPPVLLTPVHAYLDAYREAAPEEQPYLLRPPNEGVDEDEFLPVDVDEDEHTAT